MALPGHRRTSSHKRRRASHFALKKINLGVCPSCQSPRLPHQACTTCGMYAGRAGKDVSRDAKRVASKKLSHTHTHTDAEAHTHDEGKSETV